MAPSAPIDYLSMGTGGIPIICLHGIGGNIESFQPQLDRFFRDPTDRCLEHARLWEFPAAGQYQFQHTISGIDRFNGSPEN